MDKTKLLASYTYVLANGNGTHNVYALEQLNYGKLFIPLKIKLIRRDTSAHEIFIQFLDSPKWTNCSYHKLFKLQTIGKNSYVGKRCLKHICLIVHIIPNNDWKSFTISIRTTNKGSKVV